MYVGGKETGFGFNAEWYDAATGMQNLRARQYEPAMNRFSQKDKLQGNASTPLSLNRYTYVQNNPVRYADPSGMRMVDAEGNTEYPITSSTGKVTGKTRAPATVTVPETPQTLESASATINSLNNAISNGYYSSMASDDPHVQYAVSLPPV